MTNKDKMHNVELYQAEDKELLEEQQKYMEKLYDYNHTRPKETKKREKLLKELFAEIGEGCYIEPPLHANWGGHYVHLGQNVYANFNLTLVDDTHIYIGDDTMIGPNVVIAAGTHPILPELRREGFQYNVSIHIGKNCWLGSGAIILPGVTIGDHTIVGAGSVVTKDLPANVLAAGNPCRVLREISGHDRKYYYKDRKIDDRIWDQLNEENGKRYSKKNGNAGQ